jgi:hypothetical protein
MADWPARVASLPPSAHRTQAGRVAAIVAAVVLRGGQAEHRGQHIGHPGEISVELPAARSTSADRPKMSTTQPATAASASAVGHLLANRAVTVTVTVVMAGSVAPAWLPGQAPPAGCPQSWEP